MLSNITNHRHPLWYHITMCKTASHIPSCTALSPKSIPNGTASSSCVEQYITSSSSSLMALHHPHALSSISHHHPWWYCIILMLWAACRTSSSSLIVLHHPHVLSSISHIIIIPNGPTHHYSPQWYHINHHTDSSVTPQTLSKHSSITHWHSPQQYNTPSKSTTVSHTVNVHSSIPHCQSP